jgi:hypothetical protein
MIDFVITSNKYNLRSFYRSNDCHTTGTQNNNNNAVTNQALLCQFKGSDNGTKVSDVVFFLCTYFVHCRNFNGVLCLRSLLY